jgi:hypothetical protein
MRRRRRRRRGERKVPPRSDKRRCNRKIGDRAAPVARSGMHKSLPPLQEIIGCPRERPDDLGAMPGWRESEGRGAGAAVEEDASPPPAEESTSGGLTIA